MKIHGTAKGGALSTKDFGVAFAGDAGDGTTYSTDFSTHGDWSPNVDGVVFIDTENDMLEFVLTADNTDAYMNYNLGSNVSDTKWVLRYEIVFSTLNGNDEDNNNALFVGFYSTSDPSGAIFPSGDALRYGVQVTRTAIANILDSVTPTTTPAQTKTDVNNDPFSLSTAVPPASNPPPFYVEIKRVSADLLEQRVFTDSDYSTQLSGSTTMSRATSSAVDGTSYLTVQLFTQGEISAGYTGYIQNLKFWDGVTTPP